MTPSLPPPRRPLHVAHVLRRAGQIGTLALALANLAGCGGEPEAFSEELTAEAEGAVVAGPLVIAYGSEPDQFGELRVPSCPGPHPVAVILHGGCWTTLFGYDLMSDMSEDLTSAGIATWNIEFRRITYGGTDDGHPETFRDVGMAIDALRTLAPVHDLDLDHVVTVGHSAGGHLAIWAAARPNLPTSSSIRGADPLPLSAAVSLAGVLDLADPVAVGACGTLAGQLLGGTPAEVPERYAETNPSELVPIGVPQSLIHGTADDVIPLSGSVNYRHHAHDAGDQVSLKKVHNADHFDVITPTSSKWPQVRARILQAF
ncbi:alpha/beta hydrolase [Polyangium sp. y55x31]|uniref:alpha/beta hydrolase family protein n=1 Tax=Polyangium sp. y55x31 TaxID=3042688 RepID=UPI0024832495|nr:alpha/beta hydrolase [Polyangium sp. y55x31]MDI1477794.1 alpha/beta hydrolase [Polyangium sp. y55x31]